MESREPVWKLIDAKHASALSRGDWAKESGFLRSQIYCVRCAWSIKALVELASVLFLIILVSVPPNVCKKYLSAKSWPVSIENLNLSQPLSGKYVAALAVDHGTVSVTYGNRANPLLAGHVLSFRPSLNDTGAIMWTCGHASRAENPDTEIGPNLTDVKPQFLSAECR
jgi:Pilin (bacterial filament)